MLSAQPEQAPQHLRSPILYFYKSLKQYIIPHISPNVIKYRFHANFIISVRIGMDSLTTITTILLLMGLMFLVQYRGFLSHIHKKIKISITGSKL